MSLVVFQHQPVWATSISSDSEEVQNSQKPQKSIPLESFNPIQDTLQKLNNGQYFPDNFLEDFANTHLDKLKQFESKITPDDDLFDSWITLILKAFQNKSPFDDCLKIAKERGEHEQASRVAQFNLGLMYTYGKGVEEDFIKAVKYYQLAADQGYARAQHNLGYMYRNGKGIDKNLTKAIKYYHKAAKQGHVTADLALVYMYYQCGEEHAEDFTKVFEYYKKAANQENSDAQMDLGVLLRHGIMVEQDLAQSLKWFLAFSKNEDVSIKYEVEDFITFVPPTIALEDEKDLITNQKILKDNIEVFLELHGMEKGINTSYDSKKGADKLTLSFKESKFAIPSLALSYQEILDFEGFLLKTIPIFDQCGFMVNCLQPKDIEAFKSSKSSDIKYHELQGQSFLTFGQKNIEIADQLMTILDQSHPVYGAISDILGVLTEIYKSFKADIPMSDVAQVLKAQYISRIEFNLDNQTLDTTQPLTSHQQLVEKVEKEIEILTQLQIVPQQFRELLIEGAPVRNKLFIQNNQHIEPIFQD